MPLESYRVRTKPYQAKEPIPPYQESPAPEQLFHFANSHSISSLQLSHASSADLCRQKRPTSAGEASDKGGLESAVWDPSTILKLFHRTTSEEERYGWMRVDEREERICQVEILELKLDFRDD
ncbi:hypothetical protein Trydic_g15819 [Trypoxylus dichotomus]